MDEDSGLWALSGFVLLLSALAVGSGFIAMMPELQRFVVDQNGWMTGERFARAFTIAQIAPGPNYLFVSLIGLEVAGWMGAVAVTIAVALPSLIGTLGVLHLYRGRGSPRLSRALQQGLLPISVGMFSATAWLLLDTAGHGPRGMLLAALAAAVMARTKLNPLWTVGTGAIAGLSGLL